MIILKDITKTYANGFQAIKPLNLQVKKGDIMGIIGYSGAGKSTLVRLINKLETPSTGEVIIDGTNILTLKESSLQKARQKIGMIFQHFNLLDSRNVFGNVAFALEIAKWKKSDIRSRVSELLELVGLEDKADFYPNQLSGGQKQRIAIARALANHPKILLCDEATSALDTKTTQSILQLLQDIQKKLGLTIVMITHQIEVVRSICNSMCVMSNGVIVEEGQVEQIFANPKHEVTKELISFLPALSQEEILQKSHKNAYKISFVGEYIHEPLIAEIIREFNVNVNILAGNIEALATAEVGHLIVDFGDDIQARERAIEYLRSKGLIIESLQDLVKSKAKDIQDFVLPQDSIIKDSKTKD